MSKERFDPADYRRFSNRKRNRELTDEERRDQLLDFIKTSLDEVIYNQYQQNLINQNYIKLIEHINYSIMPNLIYLFERDPDEAKEKIDQARNDLLKPIVYASERGDERATIALFEKLPKHINFLGYNGVAKSVLSKNIDLLKEIDRNIEGNNIESFERNKTKLISIMSRSSVSEDDILKLCNDLDRCEAFISMERVDLPPLRAALPSLAENIDRSSSRETPPTYRYISVEHGLELIDPKKYNEKISSALNTYSNMVGKVNLAIANEDLDLILQSGKNLMNEIKGVLDKNERDEIRKDLNRIYRTISAQKEAITAVRPIAELASTQTISPINQSSDRYQEKSKGRG